MGAERLQRVAIERRHIAFIRTEQARDQLPPGLVQRSLVVGHMEGFKKCSNFVRETLAVPPLADRQLLRALSYTEDKLMRVATKEDSVPVDPSPFRVLDVIKPDKHIAFPDQLEVSQVREQIRLHDPDSSHPPSSSASIHERDQLIRPSGAGLSRWEVLLENAHHTAVMVLASLICWNS